MGMAIGHWPWTHGNRQAHQSTSRCTHARATNETRGKDQEDDEETMIR